MELTRERKVYVAVLLLAGGAFFGDRLLLGGGAGEAQAATPAPEAGGAPTAPSAGPATAGRALSVRERLRDAVSQNQPETADAFRAPASWLRAAPDAAPALVSRPLLKVTSVISGPPPAAVVNGRLVRVGDRLGDQGAEAMIEVVEVAPARGVVRVRLGETEWETAMPTMTGEHRDRE